MLVGMPEGMEGATMEEILRWGLIGCGDVTEVKSGPALQRAVGSQLLRVASRRPEQAADWARRHAVPHWHVDIDELLASPDIDAVYIATRPDSHCELTLRAAAAGKAVLVEKPMALDPAECEAMIAACRLAGVPLWVAYYRRALPRFLAIRELLEAEAIGALRAVHWRQLRPLPTPDRQRTAAHRWRVDPACSGGGLFFEAACHALDALDFLLGPLEQVQGLAANQAGAWAPEDIVSATWRHGGEGPGRGVLGSLLWCQSAGVEEECTEIIGSRGRIAWSSVRGGSVQITRDGRSDELQIPDPPHVHQPLVQTIVGEWFGRGCCPSRGESALQTARVMERLLAAPGRT